MTNEKNVRKRFVSAAAIAAGLEKLKKKWTRRKEEAMRGVLDWFEEAEISMARVKTSDHVGVLCIVGPMDELDKLAAKAEEVDCEVEKVGSGSLSKTLSMQKNLGLAYPEGKDDAESRKEFREEMTKAVKSAGGAWAEIVSEDFDMRKASSVFKELVEAAEVEAKEEGRIFLGTEEELEQLLPEKLRGKFKISDWYTVSSRAA